MLQWEAWSRGEVCLDFTCKGKCALDAQKVGVAQWNSWDSEEPGWPWRQRGKSYCIQLVLFDKGRTWKPWRGVKTWCAISQNRGESWWDFRKVVSWQVTTTAGGIAVGGSLGSEKAVVVRRWELGCDPVVEEKKTHNFGHLLNKYILRNF